ncbi:MAG: DNA-binding protein Alba [Candidatus Bathyarchaeia archaeon]
MEKRFSTESATDSVVLVGKKPLMNYVLACLTLFNEGRPCVVVRARGSAISRAVDTVQLLKKAFVKDLTVEKISIGTQEFKKPGNVNGSTSMIEIVISKHSSGTQK